MYKSVFGGWMYGWQVLYFMALGFDAVTILSWRPHTIDGVPNIPGV
jgi:hypothetical protein